MTATITINDPSRKETTLARLQLGDFFLITGDRTRACLLIEFVHGTDGTLHHAYYVQLEDGLTYTATNPQKLRVQKLRLVSAEFDLKETR